MWLLVDSNVTFKVIFYSIVFLIFLKSKSGLFIIISWLKLNETLKVKIFVWCLDFSINWTRGQFCSLMFDWISSCTFVLSYWVLLVIPTMKFSSLFAQFVSLPIVQEILYYLKYNQCQLNTKHAIVYSCCDQSDKLIFYFRSVYVNLLSFKSINEKLNINFEWNPACN